MDTVIIDVSTRFTDQTGPGLDKTRQQSDKAYESMKKAQQQADKFGKTKANATLSITDKATESVKKVTAGVKNLAGKTFSMTMRVVDFATSPLRSIFNFATSIKGLITGLIAGVAAKKAIMEPINLADTFTSAEVGFETKLGSLAKAQKMMKDIQEFAIKTPFETTDVINTSQKMLAMGWQAKSILPDLEKIGNASASMGKGSDGIERITLALSQMRMKGKVSAEEMLQLTEVGINGWGYLSKALGKSVPQIQKMTEKGLIPVDTAIKAIISGMSEFDGMMDKTATKTVGGIISQIKDLFTISIVKNWGEGLQSGAIRGLAEMNDWLTKNRTSFDKFGTQMKVWGTQFSNTVVDSAEKALKTVSTMMDDPTFQKADFWGKTQIAWDKLVEDPFAKWWDGAGGQKVRDVADKAGTAIGESIAKGIATAFGKLLPAVASDAATLLPGGASPSGTSLLSAGALLWGGSKVGGLIGKAAGGIGGLFGATAAAGTGAAAGAGAATAASEGPLWMAATKGAGAFSTGTAATGAASTGIGATALAAATTAGALAALGGLAAAGSDLAYANTQETKKGKQDAYWKAGARTGMVSAGAAAGGIIGSVIPGAGNLAGALVGAGIGGLAAMFGGGKLGKWVSDWSDGTLQINKMSDALGNASKNAGKLSEKDKSVQALITDYQWANRTLNDGNSTVKDRTAAQAEMKTVVQKLADIYPDLISQYDLENGRLGEKLNTIKNISALEKEQGRIQLQQAAQKGKDDLPNIAAKYKSNASELADLQKREKSYTEGMQKLYQYKSEVEKLTLQKNNLNNLGNHSKDTDINNQLNAYMGKINMVTRSLDNTTYNTTAEHFFDLGAFDTYANKLKNIQNAELNSLKTNSDLQSKYNAVYDAQKQLIELNLGGTIDEQAAKYDKLGKTAQDSFLSALNQIKALQDSMDLLPSDKKVNIDLITRQTILKDIDNNTYNKLMVQHSKEARMGYATGTSNASRGYHVVGENGPELKYFNGGETVKNSTETKRILKSQSGGLQVVLGGSSPLINITIPGAQNSASVISAIRKNLPEIADELCAYIAKALKEINGNSPVTEG